MKCLLTTDAVALLASVTLLAAPDFTTSAITADPAAPVEGDVVTFTVVVRNTGDQESPYTQVSVGLPAPASLSTSTGSTEASTTRTRAGCAAPSPFRLAVRRARRFAF